MVTVTPLLPAGPPLVPVEIPALLPAPLPPERELELETPTMASPGQQLQMASQPAALTKCTLTPVLIPELPIPSPAISFFLLFILCIYIFVKIASFKIKHFISF